MKRLGALLVSLALVTSLAWGQMASLPVPYTMNLDHPLLRGLVSWHVVLPHLRGGLVWYDLIRQHNFTLSGTWAAGSGFLPPSRAAWWGEVRMDGSNQGVFGGTDALWDFANTTFTVMLRFRTAATGTQQYLIAKRSGVQLGGWFLRIDSGTNTMTARILGSTGNAAARSTASTTNADGLWHSVLLVFTTDTVTAGNNAITIYRDGIPDQGTQTSTPDTYTACTVCRLSVGIPDDGTASLIGAVDSIRLWSRGLSAAEALAAHLQQPPTFGGMVHVLPTVVGQPLAVAMPRRITTQ